MSAMDLAMRNAGQNHDLIIKRMTIGDVNYEYFGSRESEKIKKQQQELLIKHKKSQKELI